MARELPGTVPKTASTEIAITNDAGQRPLVAHPAAALPTPEAAALGPPAPTGLSNSQHAAKG